MRNVVGSLAFSVVVMFGSGSASAQETKAAPSTGTVAAATKTSPKRAASRSDVSVGAALARCDDSIMQGAGTSPTRAATPAPSPAAAPTAIVEAQEGRGLADIHVAQSNASGRAGTAREVQLNAVAPGKAARPVATVRMQRKMNVDRAMASVATAIEACRASAGTAGAGSSVATVGVQLDVSATGEVEKAEMTSMKGSMAKPAVACVLAALGNVRFGAPGPMGASLTVPVSLGQDRGDSTRLASAE